MSDWNRIHVDDPRLSPPENTPELPRGWEELIRWGESHRDRFRHRATCRKRLARRTSGCAWNPHGFHQDDLDFLSGF